MKLVRALYNQKVINPAKLPPDLRASVDILLAAPTGQYNETLDTLDYNVFEAIKKIAPANKKIIAISNQFKINQAEVNNDGFNTILPDEATPVTVIKEKRVPKDLDTDLGVTFGQKFKDGKVIVAHGTSSNLLPQIYSEGLKRGKGKVWEDTSDDKLFFEVEPSYTHYGNNVYAWKAIQKYGGVPVILYIKIEKSLLHTDRDDSDLGPRYQKTQKECSCDIAPENIVGLRVFGNIDIKRDDFIEFYQMFADDPADKVLKSGGVVTENTITEQESNQIFDYLNHWIDKRDKAELIMIDIRETNWYPTKHFIDYARDRNFGYGSQVKDLYEKIKNGAIVYPIIVEKSKCSTLDQNLNLTKQQKPCYSIRDGMHRVSIYEDLGIYFIPALVYQHSRKSITRDFGSGFKTRQEFEKWVGVSIQLFYKGIKNQSFAEGGGILGELIKDNNGKPKIFYRGTETPEVNPKAGGGNEHFTWGVSTTTDEDYATFNGENVKKYYALKGEFIDYFDLIDMYESEKGTDDWTEKELSSYGKEKGYIGTTLYDPQAGLDHRFFDAKSLIKVPETKVYSEPKRYNAEIKLGQKYYDNRYGDFYTIEKMTPVEGGDVDVILNYDKGKIRTESGNFLLYHIDAKQHSLSKMKNESFSEGGQFKNDDNYIALWSKNKGSNYWLLERSHTKEYAMNLLGTEKVNEPVSVNGREYMLMPLEIDPNNLAQRGGIGRDVVVKDKGKRYETQDGDSYANINKDKGVWNISMIESGKSGDGRKIVNKIIRDAIDKRVKKIELSTTEFSGYGFFDKMGFVDTGREQTEFERDFGGGGDIFMELDLSTSKKVKAVEQSLSTNPEVKGKDVPSLESDFTKGRKWIELSKDEKISASKEYKKTVPKTTQGQSDEFIKLLSDNGIEKGSYSINKSDTNFGKSNYFTFNLPNGEDVTVRVSDHSTGTRRFKSELQYDLLRMGDALNMDGQKLSDIIKHIKEKQKGKDIVVDEGLKILDNYEVNDVVIPDKIENESNWQEKLVDKAFVDMGLKPNKKTAGTGTIYYTFKDRKGENVVIRLGDHSKGHWAGREVDGNAVYDKYSTPQDVLDILRDALPDGKIVKEQSLSDNNFAQGGKIKLLAPNGQHSNLTPKLWHLVRTPEFKAWFGDWESDPKNASKVIDQNGEPLVVYHGTTRYFNEFDFNRPTIGFHFGELKQAERRIYDVNLRDIKKYTIQDSDRILPFFLNIRRVLSISKDTKDWDNWSGLNLIWKELKFDGKPKDYINIYKGTPEFNNIRDVLESKIDGIKYINYFEGGGVSFIVFNNTNMKLADGSNTTFNPKNPDMRFKQGGTVEAAPGLLSEIDNLLGFSIEEFIPENKLPKPVIKLEDYGEKIGGAKKDLRERLSDISSNDLITEPLSKIFPVPDYKKLVAEKTITQGIAILLKYLYDSIPTKPRKTYYVKSWVNKVQAVINLFQLLVGENPERNKEITDAYIKSMMYNEGGSKRYEMYSKTLEGLGFPENDVKLGKYAIRHFDASWHNDKDGNKITTDERYTIVSGFYIVKDYPTMEDAIDGLRMLITKAKDKLNFTVFSIYEDRRLFTDKFFIGKKTATAVIRVVEGFATAKAAVAFLEENKEQVQALWDAMHINVEERRLTNRDRIGTDWRKGKNISSEDFAKTFGFRGVEFGNWVNHKERQDHVNEAFDSLMDLTSLTGLTPNALSLNGELAFAFGARGSGNANAHYEPDKVVINLTKTRGAGSLGHEWWHSLDNYFSRARGFKNDYITESPRPRYLAGLGFVDDSRLRMDMISAYKGVMDAINDSKLPHRSAFLDRTKTKLYWSTALEMSARSFENFLINKMAAAGQQNDYLANFKEIGEWIRDTRGNIDAETNYPYPLPVESPAIDLAYQQFFDTIKIRRDESGRDVLYEQGGKIETGPYQNIPVFRGTGNKINATYGGISDDGIGTFYTDNYTMAAFFADILTYDDDRYEKTGNGGKVTESKISFKKPYIIDASHPDYDLEYDYDSFQIYMREIHDAGGVKPYKEKLQAQGYDGIILKSNTTNYYDEGTYDILIKFDQTMEDGGEVKEIPDTMNTSYDKRVMENMKYIGSEITDWRAVPISGTVSTPGPKGKTVEMPVFDFPKGYKESKTLYKSSQGNECCELCGHMPIKRLFWIQNDKEKTTLSVGSECVGYFGEGKTGKENLRDTKMELAKMLDRDLTTLSGIIIEKFSRMKTEYGYYTPRQVRVWDSISIDKDPGFDNSKVYQAVKDMDLNIMFDQKRIEKFKKYYGNQPDLLKKELTTINWATVYSKIPVFSWENEMKEVERKYISQESAEKRLLTWFKKNEAIGRELIEKTIALMKILGKYEENMYNSEYLSAVNTV